MPVALPFVKISLMFSDRRCSDAKVKRKGIVVLIRVEYCNGHFDMVKPKVLDQLLVAESVIKFWREQSWIHTDYDPLRKTNRFSYVGDDRRQLDS